MLHAVLHKEIVTGATCSAAGVLKDPPVVNWKDTGKLNPVDRNTTRIPPRTTTQVHTGTGPSVPSTSIGSQEIEGPRRPIIFQEVRNAEPIDASINRITAKHRDPASSWIKVVGSKIFTNESAGVYAFGQMNLGSDTVLSESPKFMDFGMSSVNTMDELRSVFIPNIRIGRSTHGSNWLSPGHDISVTVVNKLSGTKAKNHYNFKI